MKNILLSFFALAALIVINPVLASQRPGLSFHDESVSHRALPPASKRIQYILLAKGKDDASIKQRKEFYESLSDKEKEKLKKARRKYRNLSDKDKQKLRKRWENKPEGEKTRYKKWKQKDIK